MSRFSRGAPVQYANGGQSHAARTKTYSASGMREKNIMHILHNKPEELHKHLPRLNWNEVKSKFINDENREWLVELAQADTKAVECEYFNSIPEILRFQAALALYECRAPVASVRNAVELAWINHSTIFKALAGADLYPMLRYCGFKPPVELGAEFRVYRGTRGVSVDVAKRGKSWTTDRRVACVWINQISMAATNNGGRVTGAPLVISRMVRAEDVVLYSNQQDMFEVVLDDHVAPEGEPDGNPQEWARIGAEHRQTLLWAEAYKRAVEGSMQGGGGWQGLAAAAGCY